jgi:Xaa-Pro aminopeptidase
MKINQERIEKAQQLMRQEGMIGIMIMTRDDYRYFFGETRVQPRAILPAFGDPVIISFKGEAEEIQAALGDQPVKVFSHVGEQMSVVSKTFRTLAEEFPQKISSEDGQLPKVGMQLWFNTPAFLVDLFRKLNPQVELVSSDPVMDELRMVKDVGEIELLTEAQEIAARGMDIVSNLIEPGRTGQEIAAEATCAMLKAGASGTSTPIHINIGIRSCWIHGKVDETVIQAGDLVVADLTPMYRGYCANLARTFVVGQPDEQQQLLLDTYQEIITATRDALKPGVTVARLDKIGKAICAERGLEDYHLRGISHGIGLRFEETPASTILPPHSTIQLRENMVMTIGHTVLAIPGFGGVRFEDLYRVTPDGGELLFEYPREYRISYQ